MAVTIDAGGHPLVDGSPPGWASAWGQDRFGVYVAFRIGTATHYRVLIRLKIALNNGHGTTEESIAACLLPLPPH